MKRHYVYVLMDPRRPGPFRYGRNTFSHEPFYVGKGVGGRVNVHWAKFLKGQAQTRDNTPKLARFRHLLNEGYEPIAQIKYRYDTQEEAYDKEFELIAKIKRIRYGGPLLNLSAGGKGSLDAPREKYTQKRKQQMSAALLATYATEEGQKAIEKMKASKKIRLEATHRRCKRDKQFAEQRSRVYSEAGKVAWQTIKSDPLYLAEFKGKIAAKALERSANASPKQKAIWAAQKRLGHLIKKVPERKRVKVKEQIYSALSSTRLRTKDKIYAMMDEMLHPHLSAA